MSIVVNTNTQSLFAQRALRQNTMGMQKSVEKLSTGFRINRAGDDAAGLSISEKMTMKIKGLDQSKRNINDGISLIQTAEGALGVVQDNLQRIRELMVQGANGTNSDDELDAIQREINERVTTISDIQSQGEFNGIEFFGGAGAPANVDLQVGADQGDTLTLSFSTMDLRVDQAGAAGNLNENSGTDLDEISVSANVQTVGGTTAAAGTLDDLDNMIQNTSRMRSELGAFQNSLESRLSYLDNYSENMQNARSQVRDVDVATESSNMLKQQILQQSSASMVSQANATPQIALNLLP